MLQETEADVYFQKSIHFIGIPKFPSLFKVLEFTELDAFIHIRGGPPAKADLIFTKLRRKDYNSFENMM